MATRVVGGVAIKAIPDVRGFNTELRNKLRALPQTKVVIEAELSDASVQKIRAQLQSLADRIDVKVSPTLDRDSASRMLDDLTEAEERRRDAAEAASAEQQRNERETERQAKRAEEAVRMSMGRIRALQAEIARNFDRDVGRGIEIDDRYLQRVEDKFNDSVQRMRDDLELKFEATLPDAELMDVRAKVEALLAENQGRNITFDADLDSAAARAKLLALTRDRDVDITVRVNRSALDAAAQTLAYLTGVRTLGESGRSFVNFMRTVDENLPKLAFMFTSISAITSSMVGLLTSLLSFGAGVVKILPLFLTLPGLLLGAVTAIGLMSVAWADVGKHLDSLTPKFTRLGDIISDSYWAEARGPILDLVNGLMPQLESSMERASRALGSFTGALADSFARELAGGRLERIFETFEEGFGILERGTDSFAGVIVNLAQIGGTYFPALAGWINDIAGRFDSWLTDIQADGRLEKWIKDATREMGFLWEGIEAGGGMLRGFWLAAEAAGAGGMAGFAKVMGEWNEAVNSPSAQFALTQIFAGGRAAASSFGNAIGHLLSGLGRVSPLVRDFMTVTGMAFDELGRLFGDMLGSEGLWTGFSSLMGDLRSGFERLLPAAEPFANKMGQAAEFVGTMADSFAGPMAEAIIALEEPVTRIFDALGPLVEKTGAWLESIITSDEAQGVLDSIAGTVETLATELGKLFDSEALNTALYDALVIVDAVIQGIGDALPGVNGLLDKTLGLIDSLLPRLESAESTGDTLGRVVGGFFAWASLLPMLVQGVFSLGTALVVTLDTGVRFVKTAVLGVLGAFALGIQWVGEVAAAVWDGIVNWDFASIGENISDINIDYGRMFEELNSEVEVEGAFAAEQFERAWNDYNALDADLQVQQEWAQIYAQEGAEAAQAFLDSVTGGVAAGQPDVNSSVGGSVDQAVTAAAERARQGVVPGAALADGMASGVTNNRAAVANATTAAVNGAASGASGAATAGGQQLGANIGQGIADGISWADWAIRQSATSAVRRALAAAQGAAEIASPSKLFRREVGAYIGEGIALGIEDGTARIEAAAVGAIPVPASIDWSGTMLDPGDTTSADGGAGVVQNIYAQPGMDEFVVGTIAGRELASALRRSV